MPDHTDRRSLHRLALSAVTALAFTAASFGRSDSWWIAPNDGAFLDPAKWSDGVPGADTSATFGLASGPGAFTVSVAGINPVLRLLVPNQSPVFTFEPGARLDVTFDSRLGSDQMTETRLTGPGTLSSGDLFWVGVDGAKATLVVENGATLDTVTLGAGHGATGEGHVIVRNGGSIINSTTEGCCNWAIGWGGGDGTLTVESGGALLALAQGAHTLSLGADPGSMCSAVVQGRGSTIDRPNCWLRIGVDGATSSLSVLDAAVIDVKAITVGLEIGSVGSLTLDAASITATDGMIVGAYAQGTAVIEDGAQCIAGPLTVGTGSNGDGFLAVRDRGTFLRGLAGIGTNGGIDQPAVGEVVIENGAHASSLTNDGGDEWFVFLGIGAGAQATVTVRDPGTVWDGVDWLTVGGVYHTDTGAHGFLNVENGALVSCKRGIVSEHSLDTGSVTVDGSGSLWNIAFDLTIGDADGDGGVAAVATQGNGRVACGSLGVGSQGTLSLEVPTNGMPCVAALGNAGLGGSLVVTLPRGFVPAPGSTFDLIAFGSASGQFDSVSLPRGMLLEQTASSLRVIQLDTVVSVTVTPDPLSVVEGFSVPLSAVAELASGTTLDVSSQALWLSDAPSIASVTAEGTLTGLALGSAGVTAEFNGVIGSTEVTVLPLPDPLPTERISVSASGEQGNLGSYFSFPFVTPDGRFVVFASEAQNLVSPPTQGVQVFVKDTLTGAVDLVSRSSDGTPGNNLSADPSISADGRFVTFRSAATNLGGSPPSGTVQIYLRDRTLGTTSAVSVTPAGAFGSGTSLNARISANGLLVVFDSNASDLVRGDTNGQSDVFLRDLGAGTTSIVSVAARGAANGQSTFAAIDGEGRYVVFGSTASNLVPNDTNGVSDVFLKDLALGTIERVDLAPNGAEAVGGDSAFPVISANARSIAFLSFATNLVPSGGNGKRQCYVVDRATGETQLASKSEAGAPSAFDVGSVSVCGDGKYVAFRATDGLVSPDTNGVDDVYRFAVVGGAVEWISTNISGDAPNGLSRLTALDDSGSTIVFQSLANDLVPLDTNGVDDTFLRHVMVAPAADLDGDGSVAGPDLGILLGGWGAPGVSDINGDGTTDAIDLAILLGQWTG